MQARTAEHPNSPVTDLCFSAVLMARTQEAKRKTERTRNRLLASLADHLADGVDRRELKVASVTAKAEVAHGTFYRYFDDIRAATDALIEDFALYLRATLSTQRGGEPGSLERVRGTSLVYARLFADNAALMKCLFDMGSESTAFARSYQELNQSWYERTAMAIARHKSESGEATAPEEALPVAYALGGMVDEFLTQIHLRKAPALAHYADDPEAVADLLTDLWLKGAYGSADC
jgi:AcrR family transcriptional regulator